MRVKIRLRIVIIICMCTAVQSFGQTDTLKHFSDGNDFKVEGRFRDRNLAWSLYVVEDFMHEDGYLIKYVLGTKIEYKLLDYHSLGAGINLLYYDKFPQFSSFNITYFSMEIELGYRYYHNLRKRMSKGQVGNNFSANYFLISPHLELMYMPYTKESCQWDFEEGMWAIDYYSAVRAFPGLRMGYGLQRNFAGNLNFDINGGMLFGQGRQYGSPVASLYVQFSFGYILK